MLSKTTTFEWLNVRGNPGNEMVRDISRRLKCQVHSSFSEHLGRVRPYQLVLENILLQVRLRVHIK
jgi:hypothetical protein